MSTQELLHLAQTEHREGRFPRARDLYCQLLAKEPTHAEALQSLGILTFQVGESALAVELLECARALRAPQPQALNALGEAYRTLGKAQKAEEFYREAIQRNPGFAEAHANLGSALRDQGRYDEARLCYEEALRIRPHDVVALNNLGNIDKDQGQLQAAAARYRAALALCPGYPPAETNLLFCLTYDPEVSPQNLFEAHHTWGQRYHSQRLETRRVSSRNPDKILKIGYLSGDFRIHPVSLFLEPILANHDPDCVDVTCYAEVRAPDEVTARLRSLGGRWCSTVEWSDHQLTDRIVADQIDILVELAGHTANNRLRALASHPAPIQVSYLGYPGTTGLPAMDYRLTDHVVDPPGAECHFTETLVRMPGGFCCFPIPHDAPPLKEPPAVRNGYVTFGSPHHLAKLNDAVLDLWIHILRAAPTAKLRLFRTGIVGKARERILTRFHSGGIDGARIEFLDVALHRIGYRGYLELYHEVDILLDATPASAHTTACEALAMGVPVLTFPGDRTYGRLAASILHHIGLPEWIASSSADYRNKAVRYAQDPTPLLALRPEIRTRLAATIGDAKRFTRSLETIYHDMWRNTCYATHSTE